MYPAFLIYSFCFPRCGYLLDPLGACSPEGGLPLLFPIVFPLPPLTWARLTVLFLPIVFPSVFSPVGPAGARFPSSPPVCCLNPVDGSASANIATIYQQFHPWFCLFFAGFLESVRAYRARDMSSQLKTRERRNWYCKLVLTPVHLVVSTPGPQSTCHELSTRDPGA